MNNKCNFIHKSVAPNTCTNNENICYARNCDRTATSIIILTAGTRQIPVHTCESCKSIFVDIEDKKLRNQTSSSMGENRENV